MSQLCPCGSAVEYSLCCHPYVSGEKVAPDPDATTGKGKPGNPGVFPCHTLPRQALSALHRCNVV
ncbi:hypothetical protein APX95_14545 [Escherichia coli]|nr:hypothetical protein APX95_14545 [Escherichia coli]